MFLGLPNAYHHNTNDHNAITLHIDYTISHFIEEL